MGASIHYGVFREVDRQQSMSLQHTNESAKLAAFPPLYLPLLDSISAQSCCLPEKEDYFPPHWMSSVACYELLEWWYWVVLRGRSDVLQP